MYSSAPVRYAARTDQNGKQKNELSMKMIFCGRIERIRRNQLANKRNPFARKRELAPQRPKTAAISLGERTIHFADMPLEAILLENRSTGPRMNTSFLE